MEKLWLQENKWEDVEAYLKKKTSIILPFGSVEQHGQHLPLGTDALLSQRIAEDVARKTGTLIAPPMWVGWAPHHMAYKGTMTLRPETLTQVAEDMLNSLIYHGFDKFIILNGHREANLPPLKIAMTRVRNQTGAFMAIADPFYINSEKGKALSDVDPGGIGHAEELEASEMYYLHPELCSPEKAVKNIPAEQPFIQHDPHVSGDRMLTVSDVGTYREVTKNIGVVGDATTANVEKGKAYHEAMIENISEFIRYMDEEVEVEIRQRQLPL